MWRVSDDEGGVWPVLLGVLVGLVVIILGLLLYHHLFQAGQGLPSEENCRASIIANSKIVHGSAGTLSSNIQCEAEDKTISTRDQEAARRQLAEALRFCWDRWQHGSLELFEGEGTFCNPCAFVSLQHDLTDFNRYLFTTPIKKDGPTYVQYLTSTSTEFAEGNVPELPKDAPRELLPAGQYAVLFVYAKGEAAVGKLRDNLQKNSLLTATTVAKYSIRGAAIGSGVAAGGVVAVFATMAAAGAAVPGPGWVVSAISLLGVAGGALYGAIKGGQYAYDTQITLPQWTAQVVLLPNKPEEIARWGCTKSTQQVVTLPGPEDV